MELTLDYIKETIKPQLADKEIQAIIDYFADDVKDIKLSKEELYELFADWNLRYSSPLEACQDLLLEDVDDDISDVECMQKLWEDDFHAVMVDNGLTLVQAFALEQ